MTCVHLQKLYQHCEDSQVKLSSSDLIHIVCLQCRREEVCPSALTDEYEKRRAKKDRAESAREEQESSAETLTRPAGRNHRRTDFNPLQTE